MKTAIRLALLSLAIAAAPALAQSSSPLCGTTNYDQSRNLYTIVNPAPNDVNQQCFITVYYSGNVPAEASRSPASYIVEGTYAIELSGGGGGGGGGASKDQGGGGGGAGAAPSRTVQYLSPGVYKLTIGTGGMGGTAFGGRTMGGNPTSLTNAYGGQLIAGFQGADTWTQQSRAADDGKGGVASAGGSAGGSGGDSGPRSEEAAQAGGMSQTAGYAGRPGQAGSETGRSAVNEKGQGRVVQADAGGGGGAGVGSGGSGESSGNSRAAGVGNLGGGGGGGRGGLRNADTGGRGGDGFIRLTMSQPAPQAAAPQVIALAPRTVAPAQVYQRYSLASETLFPFGQSTLTSAGESKLDDVVSRLRDVNVERITGVGYADRIGTPESNQKLSEARAATVKAYLVSKGVQSDRISMTGKGESQPVTGSNDCKGPASSSVIACLQPDRRVDIEVVGTSR